MAEKPFSIFVSSTFTDLKEYREGAVRIIRNLRNHANDMIDWPADERTPQSLSQDQLRKADLVILILAHRYGTIPQGENRSITEIEFDTAVDTAKPILAFFVNDEYPWLPGRFDVENYEKLRAFKRKVAQHCTPQYFTTPESLATLIFQSILGFDTRYGRGPGVAESGILPVVRRSKELDTQADLLLCIGYAEDGLPLVLDISRSDSLEDLVTGNERTNQYRQAWEREARKQWVERGIYEIERLPQSVRCFITRKPIADLFPYTLFSHVLSSPLNALTIRLEQKHAAMPGQKRCLGISLSSTETYVIDRLSENQVVCVRDFVFESLNTFQQWEYQFESSNREAGQGTGATYAQDLKWEFRKDVGGQSALRIHFKVRRSHVARAITELAKQISADHHQHQLVHGDLKPQNCLVSTQGIIPIDSLRLHVGEMSSAFTSVWSAPEQITGQPVSLATDIYPLGLMLARLLSAKLSGEIVTYQLVSTIGDIHSVAIVRNPRVLILDDSDEKGKRAWAEVLGKCLRFDQAERYRDAKEFAAVLENLLSDYPISGSLSFELERGELQMLQVDGEETVCRVLRDKPHGNQMKCVVCNAVNRSTARFCSQCGSRF